MRACLLWGQKRSQIKSRPCHTRMAKVRTLLNIRGQNSKTPKWRFPVYRTKQSCDMFFLLSSWICRFSISSLHLPYQATNPADHCEVVTAEFSTTSSCHTKPRCTLWVGHTKSSITVGCQSLIIIGQCNYRILNVKSGWIIDRLLCFADRSSLWNQVAAVSTRPRIWLLSSSMRPTTAKVRIKTSSRYHKIAMSHIPFFPKKYPMNMMWTSFINLFLHCLWLHIAIYCTDVLITYYTQHFQKVINFQPFGLFMCWTVWARRSSFNGEAMAPLTAFAWRFCEALVIEKWNDWNDFALISFEVQKSGLMNWFHSFHTGRGSMYDVASNSQATEILSWASHRRVIHSGHTGPSYEAAATSILYLKV